MVQDNIGLVPEGNFSYNGEGPLAILIEGLGVMGGQNRREVVENLSPLIFVTSYKVIDMIFEWILSENVSKVELGFASKVKQLKSMFEEPNPILPPVLNENKELLLTFFALYTKLLDYRNKVIHKGWGTNQQGDLAFSFVHRGISYNLNMAVPWKPY